MMYFFLYIIEFNFLVIMHQDKWDKALHIMVWNVIIWLLCNDWGLEIWLSSYVCEGAYIYSITTYNMLVV